MAAAAVSVCQLDKLAGPLMMSSNVICVFLPPSKQSRHPLIHFLHLILPLVAHSLSWILHSLSGTLLVKVHKLTVYEHLSVILIKFTRNY